MASDRAWRNSTGRPLSDPHWLKVHHLAKEQERAAFARRLAAYRPKRVVDLGCGAGDWLSSLNKVLPEDCELVGVDSDKDSLARVHERSLKWNRQTRTVHCDFVAQLDCIPDADLILLFNMASFVAGPLELLSSIRHQSPSALLAIRQYDGATIRYGPMAESQRSSLENALRASLMASGQFDHYSMDRTLRAIHESPFANKSVEFELYWRLAPFSDAEAEYYELSLDWLHDHISEDLQRELTLWRQREAAISGNSPAYMCEVELVALMS
ncbi:class I SAM-dependent methyltransferase [Candidatus Poriferisodalis sp.]|uniref:class I SAM-dependent methyltransferase n=1 Tax=Candidatus Poriferisodalis sp. TaxID=3101277 RepID=UPI003B0215B0